MCVPGLPGHSCPLTLTTRLCPSPISCGPALVWATEHQDQAVRPFSGHSLHKNQIGLGGGSERARLWVQSVAPQTNRDCYPAHRGDEWSGPARPWPFTPGAAGGRWQWSSRATAPVVLGFTPGVPETLRLGLKGRVLGATGQLQPVVSVLANQSLCFWFLLKSQKIWPLVLFLRAAIGWGPRAHDVLMVTDLLRSVVSLLTCREAVQQVQAAPTRAPLGRLGPARQLRETLSQK